MDKVVYKKVRTGRTYEEIQDAVETVMRRLGGMVTLDGDVVDVVNGNAGISMAFAADFSARTTIFEKSPGIFDVECMIRREPNSLFWICLVVGICFWPAWAVNLLYLMADPVPVYQNALDQIPDELG